MMKIPTFFHDILGEYQTKSSLSVIALFVIATGILFGISGYDELIHLSLFKQIVIWILFLDISGGVVANLTRGTDLFYEKYPKKRWIFITIHIQPVILAWAMDISMYYGITICFYTLTGAAFLNYIRDWPVQRILAGSLTGIAVMITVSWADTLPFIAVILFIFYLFKVLFSFSVFHHRGETG